VLEHRHPGRERPLAEAVRDVEAGRVVAAQLVSDADDGDGSRHARSTVRSRKCVAHEMHGSWFRIAC